MQSFIQDSNASIFLGSKLELITSERIEDCPAFKGKLSIEKVAKQTLKNIQTAKNRVYWKIGNN